VTRDALRVVRAAALPMAALAVALVVLPSRAGLVVHVWLLVLLAAGAVLAIGAVGRAAPRAPSLFDPPTAPDHDGARFASLVRLEREVALGAATAHDAHFRLLPTLRGVAAELLAARRGVDLHRNPERARELLGDETWALVRPDRHAPVDGRAAGLSRDELERVVTRLEGL
jgi:hypothetical protein